MPLCERRHDVDELVSILHAAGRPEAVPETAYRAWSEHSDRSAAGWLVFDGDEPHEIVSAYDDLVLDLVEKAVAVRVSEHRRDEVAEWLSDHLAQVCTDLEDPDLLTVASVERDEPLGHMRRWNSNDAGLVENLVDRFDVVLPDGWEHQPRSRILAAFGLSVTDQDGDAA